MTTTATANRAAAAGHEGLVLDERLDVKLSRSQCGADLADVGLG